MPTFFLMRNKFYTSIATPNGPKVYLINVLKKVRKSFKSWIKNLVILECGWPYFVPCSIECMSFLVPIQCEMFTERRQMKGICRL